MKNKIALIVSGGGMRAVFCVGALIALQQEVGFTDPDIVISGSGSTGTTSYFLARQYQDIKKIWLSLLSTKKFVNLLRVWKIMDIDYLIDTVFKKQVPLQTKKIYDCPIQYYIAATNAANGTVEYFSQNDGIDVFELMRASKAIPFFYGKSVRLNDKEYHDGSNSSGVELNIQKALDLGAERVIVLDSNTKFSPLMIHLRLFFKGRVFRKGVLKQYRERQVLAKKFSTNNKILFCSASDTSSSAMDNSASVLDANFLQGYQEIVKHKEKIKKFLS